jgi:hypothetical protein
MTPRRTMPFVLAASLFGVYPLAQAPTAAAAAAAPAPLDVLAALPLVPKLTHGVRVVVRDTNGKPAIGAGLVYVASTQPAFVDGDAHARGRCRGDEASYWAMRMAAGERHVVDERGSSRVPATTGRVLAWRDGVVATRAFTIEAGRPLPRIELDLQPHHEFTVAVLDDAGRPAPDALVSITANDGSDAFPTAVTDAAGRAAFRLLPGRSAAARVGALAATRSRIDAPLPANGGTVPLQLPACGSVRITFEGELAPGTPIPWALRSDRDFAPTRAEGRTAWFPHVEVGFAGKACATIHGTQLTAELPRVAAGTEIAVTVTRGDALRAVALRVLDPGGAPMRAAHVDVTWFGKHQSYATPPTSRARTTDEGWLELSAPARDAGDQRLVLAVRGAGPDAPVAGHIELRVQASEIGRFDHGERRIVPPPATATGVVVDTNGRPLAGVSLRALDGAASVVESAAEGRFCIPFAGEKPAEFTLQIESPAWFFTAPTSRTRACRSDQPLRLELQPAGRMRLETVGPAGDVRGGFTVCVEPADPRSNHAKVELATRFRGDPLLLPAGHWHIVLYFDGREVHRIEDVRVDAGVECHDPRFMAFDWQPFASLVTLRIEGPAGEPVDDCLVWHESAGARPTQGMVRWLVPNGGILHVVPHNPVFASEHVAVVPGEQVLRLGSGPRLVVQLTEPPVLADGHELVAFFGDDRGIAFDRDGRCEVLLACPGPRDLRLGLRRGTRTTGLGDLPAIDVPAGGLTHRLELPTRVQLAIRRATK